MEKVPVDLILDKLNGRRMSAQDSQSLEEWLSLEDNARKYESVGKLWNDVRKTSEESFDKCLAARRLEEQISPSRRRSTICLRAALATALIALAFIIPSLWRDRPVSGSAEQLVMNEVSSPLGSHTRFRLPDGTIVVLNAGSILKYSSQFGESDRNVSLEGEGYFEVASNPQLPFVVKAGGCHFRVLGTKFNLSAYDSEGLTVALMEGSLKVSAESNSTVMVPGEIVSVDVAASTLSKRKGDVSQYNSWVNGFLRFDHIELGDLVARLSREYNVPIELDADELRNLGLRISFNLSEPVGDILESLSSIIPVRVSVRDGKYEIHTKK